MESMSIREAAEATGARLVGRSDGEFSGVCTDTRQGAAGALFFALRGEQADGHRYVPQAFEAGAAGAVVEREVDGAGEPQLIVPDSLQALGRLARRYRDRFDLPVVGVTGSVGKTSTKEMIAHALRARLTVHANESNFNNEIGVPLTLFGLSRAHQAAVLEMGMRGAGQIAYLCGVAHPTIGVVTNIGLSHIELLGSREGIAAAKAELFESLPADGTAIINADDEFAGFLRERAKGQVVTFGVEKPADFRATDITFTETGEPRFRIANQEVALRAPGVHHIGNAAAACAVAATLGIPLDAVVSRLEDFQAPAMRMETVQAARGITVLNDAYNAAPDSMRAALQTLHVLAGGHRRAIAILGDMRELGAHSEAAHRFVGELTAGLNLGLLITVGEAAAEIARAAAGHLGSDQIRSFSGTDSAAESVPALLQPDDIVLVKGSRAMQMEKIVQAIAYG